MALPPIVYYHDGRHPHIYRYEPPMTAAEYQACIDELVGTPVGAVTFCLGEGRTVLHDTQVGELLGHNNREWNHPVFRRAFQNARHLIDEGNDPLRIVCERAKEKGIQLYPCLLVQNGGVNHAGIRNSNFRIENQHLEINARGDLPADLKGADGLDFKHEESRNERFALIEETLQRYDVDGFELQLANTSPLFFHPAEVEAGREIMTGWIARVYEAVKDSGGDRQLIIRLPRTKAWCDQIGFDPAAWVRRGIVDALVGESFNLGDYIDHTADLSFLTEIAKGSHTKVYGSLHTSVFSDRLHNAPTAMVRAAASNYWSQGADGLYLAQWYSMWPYQADFYERLRELADPDIMAYGDKYYYIPTDADRPNADPLAPCQLPLELEVDTPVEAALPVSDNLSRWAADGRVHEVLLRVGIAGTTELDRFRFTFNGSELPATCLRRINQMYRMSAPRHRGGPSYWFVFRLPPAHWPRQGANTLTVTLLERDEVVPPRRAVRDVELEIKYLKGKSFHRGYVDPDLGPYEQVTP